MAFELKRVSDCLLIAPLEKGTVNLDLFERILKTLITDAVIKASVIGNAKIKFSSRRIEVRSRL